MAMHLRQIALLLLPIYVAAAPPHDEAADALRASARLWDIKGRDDMVRQVVEKLLRAQPDNIAGLARLAVLDARAGKVEKARVMLDKLSARDPQSPAVLNLRDTLRILGPDRQRLSQIRLLATAGRNVEAVQGWHALFPDGPPGGPLLLEYYRAIAATPAGWLEARDAYAKLVREYPQEAEFKLQLAGLLAQKAPSRAQAVNLLSDMLKAGEGERLRVLQALRSVLLSLSGKESAALYRAYLKYDPQDNTIATRLAQLERAPLPGRAKVQDPNEIQLTRALLALDENRLDEAEHLLNTFNAPFANDGRVAGAFGTLAMRRGNQGEAVRFFRQAQLHDKSNTAKWTSLLATAIYWATMKRAEAARDAGRDEEAERLVKDAMLAQPNEAYGLVMLGEIALARGRLDAAEQAFLAALKTAPDSSQAWRGRIDIALARNQPQLARQLLAQAEASQPALHNALTGSRVSLRRADADAALLQGDLQAAEGILRAALAVDPDEVWLRYDLARICVRQGMPDKARAVMQDAPDAVRISSAWKYADALVLSSLDQWDEVTSLLQGIPPSELTDGSRALLARASVRSLLERAQLQSLAGRKIAANADIEAAQAMAGNNADLTALVIAAWQKQGETAHAHSLAEDLLSSAKASDADAELDLARIANLLELDVALDASLQRLGRYELSVEQKRRRDDFADAALLRRVASLLAAEQPQAAQQLLAQALNSRPGDVRLLDAMVEQLEREQQYSKAMALLRKRIADRPDDLDARVDLARLLAANGEKAQARQTLATVAQAAKADDIDLRLALVNRYGALGDYAQAAKILDPLVTAFPNDARITLQQGALARRAGNYEVAKGYFEAAALDPEQEKSAQAALADMRARVVPYLAAALQYRGKAGDDGISTVAQWEAPVEVRWPRDLNGRWFVQVDPVHINAGTLPASAPDISKAFGQSQVLAADGLSSPSRQSASGNAVAFGYQGDAWRFDLGTTPIGFPVQDVVGGVRWQGDFAWGSFTAGLSRRPLTSSLLAFAGTRDPASGEKWGGVREAGLDMRWSQDFGKNSVAASLGVHSLNGYNVASNRNLMTRLSLSRDFVSKRNLEISSGLVLNYWRYARNLSGYTFGQGGYYSPQSYASLTLPVDYSANLGAWSWTLHAALGISRTSESEEALFPTRPDLQALAGNPVLTGGSGGGTSKNLHGAIEYRAPRGWYVGLEGTLDRSAYYTPNYIGLYLRLDLDKPDERPNFPRTTLTPYTQY